MFTLLIVSAVIFIIALICGFYLLSHPNEENKFLNILTLLLFAVAIVLLGIYQVIAE